MTAKGSRRSADSSVRCRWAHLDRDPQLTVYTALDPATEETGAVHLIPGSHKLGCINPSHHSGFLTPEQAEQHCPAEKAITLELLPGDVALLHNYSEASRLLSPPELPPLTGLI